MDPLTVGLIAGGATVMTLFSWGVRRAGRPPGRRNWRPAEASQIQVWRQFVRPKIWKATEGGRRLLYISTPEHSRLIVEAPDDLDPEVELRLDIQETPNDPLAVAILGSPGCRLFESHFSPLRIEVSNGRLAFDTDEPTWARYSDAQIDAILKVVDRLANAVTDGEIDVPRLLLANIEHGEPAARLAALNMLLDIAPEHAGTARLRSAAAPHVDLRYLLARQDDDTTTMRALLVDDEAPERIRCEALVFLVDRLPKDELGDLLVSLLDTSSNTVARNVLSALGPLNHEPALIAIVYLAEQGRPPRSLDAVHTIEAHFGEGALTCLLGVIRHATHHGTRLAAVQALGRVGDRTAVEPLQRIASAKGPVDLAKAASRSIAQIQERTGGAQTGALSIAQGDAGALSVPNAETGALSEVDPIEDDQ